MGRILLVSRLAVRDLRRRAAEAVLLLLAVTAATTTLTLGLVLRDAASDPYQRTREATNGPDVLAFAAPYPSGPPGGPAELVLDQPADRSGLEELARAPGVVDHSGPYPVITAELRAADRTWDVQAVGRDPAPVSVDQPALLHGTWVRDGGVVLEAAFATALDVRVGDSVALDGRSFEVVGVAATAAMPPYPGATCIFSCSVGVSPEELRARAGELPPEMVHDPGLVWLSAADVRSLSPEPSSQAYVMNLRLAEPDEAQAFVDANEPAGSWEPGMVPEPGMVSWQTVLGEATELTRNAQPVLLSGAWLLGLLAVAGVSVLVGGRMADQTRRVGLLKAIGGTPGLVAAVLLAEYVLVALVAAAAGLAVGALTAPLLTQSSAGLIGGAGTPPITVPTAASVTAAALGVAVVATFVPAVRAARTSTVNALADSARPPRRTGWLIAVSARLPVPLLLALRVAARQPRRMVLAVASIAISVSGIVVALAVNALLMTLRSSGGWGDAQAELLSQILLVVLALVLLLAAVNALVITWATVLDNRHSSALARALGATPRDVSAALAAAQVLPALAGALLGAFPGAFALLAALNAITGTDSARLPPLLQLLAVVLSTVLVVTALTAVPARLAGRRPVTETLQAEHV